MNYVMTGISIYLICLLLLLVFFYLSNAKEEGDEKSSLLMLSIVSAIFAVIPAVLIWVVLFLAKGSIHAASFLTGMDLDLHQILVLSISVTIYSFTLDTLFSAMGKYIFGNNLLRYAFSALFRFMFLYIAGIFASLSDAENLIASFALTVLFFLFDIIFLDNKAINKG